MAGRLKGTPKTGGRKKGTPNKNTQNLLALCEYHNCHPFEAMLLIAMREADPRVAFDMWEKCAQYVHSKRKALEVQPPAEGGQGISDNEKAALLKQARSEIGKK